MKLKLISNGLPAGTRVVDAATGKRIENVQSVSYSIAYNAAPTLTLTVVLAEAEIEAEVTDTVSEKVPAISDSCRPFFPT